MSNFKVDVLEKSQKNPIFRNISMNRKPVISYCSNWFDLVFKGVGIIFEIDKNQA